MEFPQSIQKCLDAFAEAEANGTATRNLDSLLRAYREEQNKVIRQWHAEGKPLLLIGKFFNISKQRVEQIVNPQAEKARDTTKQAIKNGKLTRLPCRVCGNPKSEAHHEDYSKPLEVDWLCKKHHGAADRARRARLAK